jgi:(4S)-4-hydroxy-5-phosphonooxypentane-2,3-dione isomerase
VLHRAATISTNCDNREVKSVVKSFMMPAAVAAAMLLVALHSQRAMAQSASYYVNAVDIDVVPTQFDKFMAALNENATATIKEAGSRELDIGVSQKDPHHVFIFEIYNNAAAWNAHQTTAHFLKFYGTTAQMMTHIDLRPFSSVALYGSSAGLTKPLLLNAVDLDIVPAQFDAYMAAAKVNGAVTPSDPGAHEFNIATLQKDPHHVLLFDVYDDAAAAEAHRATDHFKTYLATTKDMVSKRSAEQLTSVSMFTKAQ